MLAPRPEPLRESDQGTSIPERLVLPENLSSGSEHGRTSLQCEIQPRQNVVPCVMPEDKFSPCEILFRAAACRTHQPSYLETRRDTGEGQRANGPSSTAFDRKQTLSSSTADNGPAKRNIITSLYSLGVVSCSGIAASIIRGAGQVCVQMRRRSSGGSFGN
jgi:hypothetical protein